MQSPAAHEETPSLASTRRSASEESNGTGASSLVRRTAQKIAGLLSDLARELDALDGTAAETHGTLQIIARVLDQTSRYALKASTHAGCVTVGVEAAEEGAAVNGEGADASNAITVEDDEPGATAASYKRTRRDSDAELEKELVSRKRQRLDDGDGDGDTSMQPGAAYSDDDIMSLITKEDLQNITAKLREDIQEDTSECVNHVQKLLRRFKEEWHEKNTWDFEHASSSRVARRSVVADGAGSAAAFPSPGANQDDQDLTVPDLVKQESKLISSQIRWVEDCRRIAADAHDKREENWRVSSANFHDKARQEREGFQARILHEQGMQSQTLNHILHEVKSFGLYMHNMKWETPPSLSAPPLGPPFHPHTGPGPGPPVPPVFPTLPSPAPPRGRGRGRPRGGTRGS